MSGRFGRCGFMAHSCKADMPELIRDSHPAQPVDSTMLSTVIAMPALSVSEHGDRCQEAPDVFHRKYCTNGSRHPSRASPDYVAPPPSTARRTTLPRTGLC